MITDLNKYSLESLANVSKIYSGASFLRMFREKADHSVMHTFIRCPDIYVPGKMEVDLVEANAFVRSYAIFPNDDVNIVYLTSILNAAVSWAVMTDGKLEKRSPITMKRLGNVLVRVLPQAEQKAVAYLHYLLMTLRKEKEKGSKDPYLGYWMSVYEEIQNSVALELVMTQVFKEYEIEMLNPWCALIGKCAIENPGITLQNLHRALGEELLAPQNIVIGNIKKLRVVMRTVIKQVKI